MILSSLSITSISQYEHGAHRSDAEQLVAQFPITEVEGTVALCDGGKSNQNTFRHREIHPSPP